MEERTTDRKDIELVEQRSMSGVAIQFVNDARHGAGVATGVAIVAGAAKTINSVLPGKGDKPKE